MTDTRPHLVFCYRFGLLGGVVSQLRNRLAAFEDDYRVSFLFREDHGVRRFLPPESVRIVSTPSDATAAFHELRPDVVDVIDSPWFLPRWRDAGRPGQLVLEVHTTTTNISYLDDLTMDDGIERIITVSQAMRQRLESSAVAGLAPIHVVPNCLDGRWSKGGAAHVAETKPILWVGKLDGHKRWRTAVHLMEGIMDARSGDDAAPLFIGGYTAREPSFRGMSGRITRSPALARAAWWPAVPYELMPQVFRSAGASGGLKLVTSRDESFGMSIAESIVSGCPVVAPRVGALPELLPDAAMYPPGDRAAAIELVNRSLDDAGLRAELLSTRQDVLALTSLETTTAAFRAALAG